MASYIFSDLLSQAPPTISRNVANARDWLSTNVHSVRQNKILTGDRQRMVDRVEPGGMYMFLYDPKTKAKLPYFDRFPLIFPFKQVPGGFLGLNLHYLPPLVRAKLMDGLWPYIDNDDLAPNRKLAITYQQLDRAAKLRYFKPCVKRYLNNNVKSRFVTIYPEEWNIAVFLPTERFAKAGKQTVYKESIGKI